MCCKAFKLFLGLKCHRVSVKGPFSNIASNQVQSAWSLIAFITCCNKITILVEIHLKYIHIIDQA